MININMLYTISRRRNNYTIWFTLINEPYCIPMLHALLTCIHQHLTRIYSMVLHGVGLAEK